MVIRSSLLPVVFWGLMVLTAATACKAVKKLTQFTIDYNQTITIPSTIGLNLPFNIYTPPIPTNTTTEFELHNTRANLIERIELRRLHLKLVSPAYSDFSFLNSVKVFLSAEGLPETQVAWKENIPNSVGKELDLETTNVDLKEYLKRDKISLRVSTITDKLIASEHRVDLTATFFVDARVLGL